MPSRVRLTISRPSASGPGESASPAARIPTNAEPHAATVTSPAARAAMSVGTATGAARVSSLVVIHRGNAGRPECVRSAAPARRLYVLERFEAVTIWGVDVVVARVVCTFTFTVSQPAFTALSWLLPVP